MVAPRIVSRAEHPISRRDIDPDALKVLYRLRQADHTAYLVGGSVRDLLLKRRPKDFDVGTSAHPYQVKKLFRNCWIIGRRFRLAHVKFGTKVIEVATFRRQVSAETTLNAENAELVESGPSQQEPPATAAPTVDRGGELLVHHDNTFGTPEEDAFRRDFTINALFYDIATFSIIDYVGGLEDLQAGIVRSIGDPEIRFREDPVRMLRAVAMAARLGFAIDLPILDAIATHRYEIARSSPPRLLEEHYKILRAGAAEKTFRMLAEVGLLEPVAAELQRAARPEAALWSSLGELDAYRRRFEATPDTLTNAVLLGTLVSPLKVTLDLGRSKDRPLQGQDVPLREQGVTPSAPVQGGPRLGMLPLARRDVERFHHLLSFQRRLRDLHAGPRAQHALLHRNIFRDALTWLEIHGGAPELVEHWKRLSSEAPAVEQPGPGAEGGESRPRRRRRRRRRRVHHTP